MAEALDIPPDFDPQVGFATTIAGSTIFVARVPANVADRVRAGAAAQGRTIGAHVALLLHRASLKPEAPASPSHLPSPSQVLAVLDHLGVRVDPRVRRAAERDESSVRGEGMTVALLAASCRTYPEAQRRLGEMGVLDL